MFFFHILGHSEKKFTPCKPIIRVFSHFISVTQWYSWLIYVCRFWLHTIHNFVMDWLVFTIYACTIFILVVFIPLFRSKSLFMYFNIEFEVLKSIASGRTDFCTNLFNPQCSSDEQRVNAQIIVKPNRYSVHVFCQKPWHRKCQQQTSMTFHTLK